MLTIKKDKKNIDKNVQIASLRTSYEELGVEKYYMNHGEDYKNPHEKIIQRLVNEAILRNFVGDKVLDLCCGSGEVTAVLGDREITGVDPFTEVAYFKRTGRELLVLDFQDISNGKLVENYDTVICSFAMHLCPKSLLPSLLWQLGQISKTLIIITPNKKPNCDKIANWVLVEEFMDSRVRMQVYIR